MRPSAQLLWVTHAHRTLHSEPTNQHVIRQSQANIYVRYLSFFRDISLHPVTLNFDHMSWKLADQSHFYNYKKTELLVTR